MGLPVLPKPFIMQLAGFVYEENRYEKPAFANERNIQKFLDDNPGELQLIRTGENVSISQSDSQWSDVSSISSGPLTGFLALSDFGGVIYIDGVDVTSALVQHSKY